MDHGELYTTIAQTTPVLLLALMWDSAYLDRVRTEHRPARGDGPAGFFWTKPRVRIFILSIAVLVMSTLLLDVLVLARAVADVALVRVTVVGGLVVVMGALLFRIWVDVLRATDARSDGDGS
ncbi:hypothetical protein [Frankia sp. CiP3]|uniref:hypothetical protein n=1 Tax=Frankia sp. CiP3 TaxID=2880971 RepID=UPI001EF4F39E|nr:hypothetical protein [Frankia sp. CiP3]